MADTGYQSPGTAATVDRDSKSQWFNPDNAKTQDDLIAVSSLPASDYTDWLRLTNFGFSVPSGATIDGILVEMDKFTNNENVVKDSSIRLRNSGGQVGDEKASASYWQFNDTDTYDVYGGASDDWNAGLSVSDVNSSDFGIDISANNETGSTQVPRVDHVQIKIYYTEGGVGGNIAKVNSVDWTNINSVNSVSKANIDKINGVNAT